MRVSIHQPNFLPWMGLFNKIALCDLFVVLDHVQASGGAGWLSRNRLLVNGNASWLTVPTRKSGRFGQRVRDVEIDYGHRFISKHLGRIESNYRKAYAFEPVVTAFAKMLERRYRYIAELNLEFILWVCTYLGISTQIVFSSDLATINPKVETKTGNGLILEICRTVGATYYVSGTGGLDFIEPCSFERVGISFHFQTFEQPSYRQVGSREFVSNLSILDALLNVEAERVMRMVRHSGLSPTSLES